MTEVVTEHRTGRRHPVLADVGLPGEQNLITGRSPMRWNGEHGTPGHPPRLGADTAQVLSDVLGMSTAEVGGLVRRGVVAAASEA